MTNNLRNRQPVYVKLAISILFGIVGFGASQLVDSGSDDSGLIVGLGVSLFVGGIAFVVQFLYDVEKRQEAVEEAVGEGFKKINAATELFGLVEASALKTDAMTQLVRNSTQIEATPSLVFEFAQAEINRLSSMLKTLGEGADVTYEGEDRDWMLGLTNAANATIDATSLSTVDAGGRGFVDGGLWSSDLGYRYLEAQRDAIRRNVRIRRLFIMMDGPELQKDPDFLHVVEYHRELGIEVEVLDPTRIPGTRRATLFDFIVFDGVLSYQATPAHRVGGDHSRPNIITTHLITRPKTVLGLVQRFQELWADARAERGVPTGDYHRP